MSTRTRGKNYKLIEAFAALASFLHVEETGDSKREEELYEMCAEQYLKHIDLLVAGKEPILSPDAPVSWPICQMIFLWKMPRKGLRGSTLFGVEAERLQGTVESMSPLLRTSSRSMEVTSHQAGQALT
jgi:hypothetical protein